MKANDPLAKLLSAAARAERESARSGALSSPEMPFGFATRVLSAREANDGFSFLPLFRGALACSALVAIACAGLHFQRNEAPDAYEYTLNYSLANAYLE